MSVRPDVGLERLIHGLEQELLEAPDEEFMAGAHELGMKPDSKGSAAFVGVKMMFVPLTDTMPLVGATERMASASPSGSVSLTNTGIVTGNWRAVLAESFTATGARLVTVTVTSAVLVPPKPSEMV